jgi:hypothetical protein
MTTQRETPTIDQLLQEKRGEGGSKSAAARAIGVSRQMYAQWDGAFAVPGDEWAEPLAGYLEMELEAVVLVLYRSRMAQKGVEDGAHNSRTVTPQDFDRPLDNRPPNRQAA